MSRFPRDVEGRRAEILDDLRDLRKRYPGEWWRPMDLGGKDATHHSPDLSVLCKRGLAERKPWGGWARRSYRYRAVSPAPPATTDSGERREGEK